MKVKCNQCHKPRELKNKPRNNICKKCSSENKRVNPVGGRTKYKRVCECGDIAMVGYKPEGHEKCRSCASRDTAYISIHARWAEDRKKTRYIYFCSMCPSVRIMNSKRKSCLCNDCSKAHSKRKKDYIYFDFVEMKIMNKIKAKKRYFTVCPDCPQDTVVAREITQSSFSQYGGNTRCRSCSGKARVKTMTGTKSTKTKTKSLGVSKAAIEKIRDINKAHRKAQKPRKVKPKQTLTEDEMKAKWLLKNKPTIIKPREQEYGTTLSYMLEG